MANDNKAELKLLADEIAHLAGQLISEIDTNQKFQIKRDLLYKIKELETRVLALKGNSDGVASIKF